MIPLELKRDKEGILYTDDNKDLIQRYMAIDSNPNYKNDFYKLRSTDEYIIKRPVTILNKQGMKEYKEMLVNLINLQSKITKTEFPIGYYKDKAPLSGLIVRFYPVGVSFDKIQDKQDLELLKRFYFHDDDNIHNMFLMFLDLLDNLYEMFENGIYYTDIVANNIVLVKEMLNNIIQYLVRIIDFDPAWVRFTDKDKNLNYIMIAYFDLLYKSLKQFNLPRIPRESVLTFEEAKKFVKKIEDSTRISK